MRREEAKEDLDIVAASKYILLSLLLIPYSLFAAKPQQVKLSTEQEQQFRYYWYAAKQAIEEERFDDALVLLTFCEQLSPNDGKTLDYLGSIYAAMGDLERSTKYYRLANEADPRDQWYHYSDRLIRAGSKENLKEAQRVLEKALQLNPKAEDLLESLRKFYSLTEQWKKMLAIQDRLDAIKGFNAYSALYRVNAYIQLDKPKKAIEVIDKYLEQDPTDVQFMEYRVNLMERTKAKPAALYDYYEKILALAPNNLMMLNNYAYLLATHKGDIKKAERMSQLTIREEPDNAVYLDTYGWILHLQGQDELALFYLHKALDNTKDRKTALIIQQHIHAIKK